MTIEELADQVRERLINELERVMEGSGPDWANKDNCVKFIEDLKHKRPTVIGGPFYGDFLAGILFDLGIQSRDGSGKYEAIWEVLEKGK